MSNFIEKKCKPRLSGDKPLSINEVNSMLKQINKWETNDQGTVLYHVFRFKNYYETIAFVNALAWIAHQEDHHPDIEVSYNQCLVNFSTHSIGGLSENDFICAAKIDQLVPQQYKD